MENIRGSPSAPLGVGHFGLDGEIIHLNPEYAEFLGGSPQALRGRNIKEFTYPDEAGSVTAMLYILCTTGQPVKLQRRYVSDDGSVIDMEIQISLVRDLQGNPHSVISVAQPAPGRR